MSDLARTLDDVAGFLRRFVVLNDNQRVAVALWVFHTHTAEAADTTPYLSVTSAVKRSGKSRLLEVLERLIREPLQTVNISDAALFRAIGELKPTLLFDEVDAIFGPKARDREDLRGMLNGGFRRGSRVYRMGGSRMTTLEEFPVFCPKALAGIGELPDTIRDRTIRIRLERRTADEPIERFRERDSWEQSEPIRISLASLAEFHTERLTDARPALPDELDDRAQDLWEPLLAIADLAGGDWPESARHAALALSTGDGREDDAPSIQLLRDIHAVFSANGSQRYKTAELIAELAVIEESPWADWYGKTITAHALSRLLKPYRIKTMPVWEDGKTVRGYKREQFIEAWKRHLTVDEAWESLPVTGVRSVRSVSPGSSIEAAPNSPNAPNASSTEALSAREWRGRDGAWRSYETEPPHWAGEVVETRAGGRR